MDAGRAAPQPAFCPPAEPVAAVAAATPRAKLSKTRIVAALTLIFVLSPLSLLLMALTSDPILIGIFMAGVVASSAGGYVLLRRNFLALLYALLASSFLLGTVLPNPLWGKLCLAAALIIVLRRLHKTGSRLVWVLALAAVILVLAKGFSWKP
jgi:hypothetical protein